MDCLATLCFEPLNPQGPKIFGFAEYIAALALIVVAWTIGEKRYTFNLRTARWPVRGISFLVVTIVGVLTLATDVWRASAWPVPSGPLVTPIVWQACLGVSFLGVFVAWLWTAFLSPPVFNRQNGRKFVDVSYHFILIGDVSDLRHLAEALGRSAGNIIKLTHSFETASERTKHRYTAAVEMLEVLTDENFAAAAVTAAPATLYRMFEDLRLFRAAAPRAAPFARKVLAAAVREPQSFLHKESNDHFAGPAARGQAVTRCLYADIELLDAMPFAFSSMDAHEWKKNEWHAFLRAALVAFSSYAKREIPTRSQTVIDIFRTIESGTHNLRRLNGAVWSRAVDDEVEITRAILKFIHDASESLAKGPVAISEWSESDFNPIVELARVANMIIFDAAHVVEPDQTNWWIQQNVVWSGIFDHHTQDNELVMREVAEYVVRMLWIQIRELEYSPGFVGGRLLGLCMNIAWVHGATRPKKQSNYGPEDKLLWLVHRWATKRFDWLYKYDSRVARSGFSELMSYLPSRNALRRRWNPIAGRPRPTYKSWKVEPAPPGKPAKHLLPFPAGPHDYSSRGRKIPSYMIL